MRIYPRKSSSHSSYSKTRVEESLLRFLIHDYMLLNLLWAGQKEFSYVSIEFTFDWCSWTEEPSAAELLALSGNERQVVSWSYIKEITICGKVNNAPPPPPRTIILERRGCWLLNVIIDLLNSDSWLVCVNETALTDDSWATFSHFKLQQISQSLAFVIN